MKFINAFSWPPFHFPHELSSALPAQTSRGVFPLQVGNSRRQMENKGAAHRLQVLTLRWFVCVPRFHPLWPESDEILWAFWEKGAALVNSIRVIHSSLAKPRGFLIVYFLGLTLAKWSPLLGLEFPINPLDNLFLFALFEILHKAISVKGNAVPEGWERSLGQRLKVALFRQSQLSNLISGGCFSRCPIRELSLWELRLP